MKIVLIDNYDSFTHNICELLYQLGHNVDLLSASDYSAEKIKMADKIIISPGPSLPKDYPVLKDILSKFYSTKSILGICLGHQAISQFFCADLYNLSEVVHGQAHKISVDNDSILFKNLPSSFSVALYHSWAVVKDSIPESLKITAISEDNVVMAVQHKKYDIHGIQFHPESFISEFGAEIISNFLNH